jgi:fimbrial chaperone protein
MKRLILIAAAMTGALGAAPCAAYTLKPISRVFAPSGSEATQFFEVANPGRERVALTVSFATLERDVDYVETNHDADDEFLVYPPQMIIAPGGKQTIRVTWLGAPTPAQELAYRIKVQQVPLAALDHAAAAPAAGAVRVLVTYNGSIFIRPAHAAPSIRPDSASRTRDPGGHEAIAIVLANAGGALGLVRSCTLRVTAGDQPAIELPPPMLSGLANTRVLAGGRRRYLVAWPPALNRAALKVTGQCGVTP